MQQQENRLGQVNISQEVIGSIAAIAALNIKGVVGLSAGIFDGIAKLLTGAATSKGVKVDIKEDGVKINIYVIVEYGVSIPQLAWQIQESVKKQVEEMTGLVVKDVNVFIHGVKIPPSEKK